MGKNKKKLCYSLLTERQEICHSHPLPEYRAWHREAKQLGGTEAGGTLRSARPADAASTDPEKAEETDGRIWDHNLPAPTWEHLGTSSAGPPPSASVQEDEGHAGSHRLSHVGEDLSTGKTMHS